MKANGVPLATLGPALTAAGGPGPLADLATGPGAFAGRITLAANLTGADDPAALRGTLSLSGDAVTAFGVTVDALALDAVADDGVVRVDRLSVALGPAAASGRAELKTNGPREWVAAANVVVADPRDLARRLAPVLPLALREWGSGSPNSPVALGGALDLSLTARGRLGRAASTSGGSSADNPAGDATDDAADAQGPRWTVEANLAADRLRLAVPADSDFPGLGPVTLNDVATRVSVEHPASGRTRLSVEEFAARLADGDLRITASVPLPGAGQTGAGQTGGEPSVRPAGEASRQRPHPPTPSRTARRHWPGWAGTWGRCCGRRRRCGSIRTPAEPRPR